MFLRFRQGVEAFEIFLGHQAAMVAPATPDPTLGGHNLARFVAHLLADDSLTQSVYLWSDS